MAYNDSAALRSFHKKLCLHEKILQKRMMSEVCEAESTSGGVSRRVDVVGSSGADFDHIVLQLAEGGAFEAPSVKLLLMFIWSQKVSATTNAPLLANCC